MTFFSFQPRLVIHGGAGTLFKGRLNPEREALAREGLTTALQSAVKALSTSALDAVELAVKALEDSPAFNAGRGAVYTHEGEQHMDAAIMVGSSREAGAIAGVQGIKNPIRAARKVLEASSHVLLIGRGAENFAQLQGCEFASPDYFHSDYRWQQLLTLRDSHQTALDHGIGVSEAPDKKQHLGTVGAVALDIHGELAVATSTGGMTNKRYGRVGDSPLIGCGTYADAHCAISATGHGEFFMRTAFAANLAARLRYGQYTLEAACDEALQEIEDLGGGGGLVIINAQGEYAMPFNTGRMYRGTIVPNGAPEIKIYE